MVADLGNKLEIVIKSALDAQERDRGALNAVLSESDRKLLDLIEQQITLTFRDQVKLAGEND